MTSPTQLNDGINYTALVTQHPWVTARDQKCILSPDSDGNLFVAHYEYALFILS